MIVVSSYISRGRLLILEKQKNNIYLFQVKKVDKSNLLRVTREIITWVVFKRQVIFIKSELIKLIDIN